MGFHMDAIRGKVDPSFGGDFRKAVQIVLGNAAGGAAGGLIASPLRPMPAWVTSVNFMIVATMGAAAWVTTSMLGKLVVGDRPYNAYSKGFPLPVRIVTAALTIAASAEFLHVSAPGKTKTAPTQQRESQPRREVRGPRYGANIESPRLPASSLAAVRLRSGRGRV